MSQTNSPAIKKVMISSTARDLPEHRKVVLEACLRQGMFPMMMEHLPASDADAIAESLRLVNEADLYLGIFAFRYGYVPKDYEISITEMEYNRAVERGIPRLIFIIDKVHAIKFDDVEMGEGASKLNALKARMKNERVVNFFKSPEELHSNVINSLSHYRQSDPTAFHYVSDIPVPPEPYIAHPYTLLQTRNLVGRQAELNLLTDWVTKPRTEIYWTRVLNIVAIGGMGKSALTWKWFNDIAPHEMQSLSGRLWWSFYESDASFDNFVIRALAYVSKRSREEVQALPSLERERQLLTLLDREPYLIVLDGLERLLLAYARLDAARLADNDLDEQTANRVAGALGLPESAAQSFVGQHRLRKAIDPRIDVFFRKMAQVRASRILITTRLYPAALQSDTGGEWAGCKAVFLRGLSDEDALGLWRTFGVSGSQSTLLPLFQTFDHHPLLIKALAGVVANDRRTPGDFDRWRANHPDFDPFRLSLVQVRSHVLTTALAGLSPTIQQILFTIAAFRMPTSYDVLIDLFVGPDKTYTREDELVEALTELEDRGLLGWDRRANRYDLHPIVRGVTWSNIGKPIQQSIYTTLNDYFKSIPEVDKNEVKSIDDLTVAIELYHTLIGLERFDEAFDILDYGLLDLLIGLGAELQIKVLGEALFPQGITQDPALQSVNSQGRVCLLLGLCSIDQTDIATHWYRQAIKYFLLEKELIKRGDLSSNDDWSFNLSLVNTYLAEQLCLSGSFCLAEAAASHALMLARNSDFNDSDYQDLARLSLTFLGLTYAARGNMNVSERAFKQGLTLKSSFSGADISPYDSYALAAFWDEQINLSSTLAQHAITFYGEGHYERRRIRALWIQGMAELKLDQWQEAEEHLQQALLQARELSQIAEEIPARIWLAELRRLEGNIENARQLLNEVWETAERGSFRLFLADAYNVLAQIERDAGRIKEAADGASQAYRLAWCDGPPFAYHWGLQKAKAHLAALGEPEPALPQFDASKYEPMPEVEIEPSN